MAQSPAVFHNVHVAPRRLIHPGCASCELSHHHLFALPSLSLVPFSLAYAGAESRIANLLEQIDDQRFERPVSFSCRLPLFVCDSPRNPSLGFGGVGTGVNVGLKWD